MDERPSSVETDPAVRDLINRASEQTSRLIREELRLARVEMSRKGKAAGLGFGMLGGAGIISLFGVGALVAAAIIALAIVVPAWAAAVIVAGVLFVLAAVSAVGGRREVKRAMPPAPRVAAESARQDVRAVREGVRS